MFLRFFKKNLQKAVDKSERPCYNGNVESVNDSHGGIAQLVRVLA